MMGRKFVAFNWRDFKSITQRSPRIFWTTEKWNFFHDAKKQVPMLLSPHNILFILLSISFSPIVDNFSFAFNS